MSFLDKMQDAGEDIKDAFAEAPTIWPKRRET